MGSFGGGDCLLRFSFLVVVLVELVGVSSCEVLLSETFFYMGNIHWKGALKQRFYRAAAITSDKIKLIRCIYMDVCVYVSFVGLCLFVILYDGFSMNICLTLCVWVSLYLRGDAPTLLMC